MKKRLLAALLALSMVTAFAVSCEDDQGSSSQSSSSVTASDESSGEEEEIVTEITLPITEEPVTFTCWKAWSSDYLTNLSENYAFQEMARLTGVTIDFTCVPASAAKEKFGLLLASGEYTDMIDGENPGETVVYPGGLDAGVSDGILRDMTEYVRKYMPNYRALLETYPDILQVAITDEGRNVACYGIRADLDYPTKSVIVENEPAWCGMAIRQDWLDELNLEIPTTIDELHDVLVAFRDNYGAWMHLYQDGTIGNDYILSAYGVTQDFYMIDGGDTVGFGPTTEAYKTYVTLMRDWYAQGLIDPDFVSTNSTFILTDNEYYANDKCGVGMSYHGTSGRYHYINGYTDNEDMYLRAMVAPVLNEGDEVVTTWQSMPALRAHMTTTNLPEELMPIYAKWLDWHYTYDYAVLMAYGIEGESYEIDENSEWYFVFTDRIKNPETPGMTPSAAKGLWTQNNIVGYMDWTSGFELNALSGNTWTEESYETWEQQTDQIMLPMYASLTTEESQEYQSLYVDIESYVAENTVQFIVGSKDIDTEWDAYLAELENMNVDRCVELKQASVDRYYNKHWVLADDAK